MREGWMFMSEVDGFEADPSALSPEEVTLAIAELDRVRAEYAQFRADVIRVGSEEANQRGWCSKWKRIAVAMGIRPDELPSTHGDVTVNIGGVELSFRLQYGSTGEITPLNVIRELSEALRYGELGKKLARDPSWFTVTAVPYDPDDYSDD
jgi:hypothetical protein